MENGPLVVFGAGNIGRGLLAEISSRQGRHVLFVEAAPELARRLDRAGAYRVHLSGRQKETRLVQGYQVVETGDRAAVKAAIGQAGLAAVAVGAANLPAVAATLAPALQARAAETGEGPVAPLPVLVCENQHGADRLLAEALRAQGAPDESFTCLATSIERMVRPAADSLDLYAEAGQSLYVERVEWDAAAGDQSPPGGVIPVDGLDAYYARKLYTNNAGHALLAYMGWQRGYSTIAQSAADAHIAGQLRQLLDAAAEMLVRDYGLDPAGLDRHVDELVSVRFANAALADPVSRVARDPLRKLGPDDRLVGLLRRLAAHGLPGEAVCRTIAAAMRYRNQDDNQSQQLAVLIEQGGPALVLERVCGIGPRDPGYLSIIDYYYQTEEL